MTTSRAHLRRPAVALLLGAALAAASAAVLPSAAAGQSTTTYAIPGPGTFPEGVTARGATFYVTATSDGTLYRGTTDRPSLTVFKPGGTDGRSTAIGLEVSARGDRLVVAGGPTGQVFVYDTADGRLVAKYTNGRTSGTFLNDVAFDRAGNAYVTDSMTPALYRIPAAQIASGTGATRALATFVDFTRTAFRYQPGFNANGIALTPDGTALLVVQSGTGDLFRVELATRGVQQVDLDGRTLVNGDGLEVRGTVLYVTRNRNGVISKVKLSADGTRGTLYGQISSPAFRFPTTSAFAGARLLVVNSQFNVRGTPTAPAPFTVTGLVP